MRVLCWVKSVKPWHLVCTQSLFSLLVSKEYLKQFTASLYAAAGCFTLAAHGIIQSFSSQHHRHLGPDKLLLQGAILCMMGCLTAPHASTHQMPAPERWYKKCLHTLPNVPWDTTVTPVENHWPSVQRLSSPFLPQDVTLVHYVDNIMLPGSANQEVNNHSRHLDKIHVRQRVGNKPHKNSGICLLSEVPGNLMAWELLRYLFQSEEQIEAPGPSNP